MVPGGQDTGEQTREEITGWTDRRPDSIGCMEGWRETAEERKEWRASWRRRAVPLL